MKKHNEVANQDLPVTTSLSVSHSDIVTMHVSDIETKLESKLEELQQKQTAIMKEYTGLITEKNKEKLIKQHIALAEKSEIMIKAKELSDIFDKQYSVKIKCDISDLSDIITADFEIDINTDWEGRYIFRDFSFQIPVNEELKQLALKGKQLLADSHNMYKQICEIKHKLSDIPRIERQIKAKVTKKMIENGGTSINVSKLLQLEHN